jgi:hypothetical protein
MSGYDRDGTGALFKNERKQPGERTPDYRGDCTIDGKRWEIAAWIKTKRAGRSSSLKPRAARAWRGRVGQPCARADPGYRCRSDRGAPMKNADLLRGSPHRRGARLCLRASGRALRAAR